MSEFELGESCVIRVANHTSIFMNCIVELHMSEPTLLQSIAEYDFSKIHGRSKGMAGARAARALQVVVSMALCFALLNDLHHL